MGLTPARRLSADLSSRINAARIAGIDNKKENSPAFSLSRPAKREAEMVLPEREIPGITPMP